MFIDKPGMVKCFWIWCYENWHKIVVSGFTLFVLSAEAANYLPAFKETPEACFQSVKGFLDNDCVATGAVIKGIIFFFLILATIRYWHEDSQQKKQLKLYRDLFLSSQEGPENRLNNLLKNIADTYIPFKHSQRVSVYKFDNLTQRFYLIGRFSPDPVHCGNGRREIYDYDVGVIGKTWHDDDGKYILESLPNPKNLEKYKKAMEKHGAGIPDEQLVSIRMKSRSYYGYKIMDPGSSMSCGVIIFECAKPYGFSALKLHKMVKSNVGRVLEFLVSNRETPTDAAEEGF